jgi:hypothetical protein
MNFFKKASIFLLFTLSMGQFANGQSNLTGSWVANCVPERLNSSSIQFCELCPVSTISEASFDLKEFKLKFDKNNIQLTIENKVTDIPFQWNSQTEAIEFNYNSKSYKFKVLQTHDLNLIILKNSDGNLIILTKK